MDEKSEAIVKERLLQITRDKKPETIRQLIFLLKKEMDIPEKDILHIIETLEEEKRLEFSELMFPESYVEYLFSARGLWYWIVVIFSVVSAISVFSIFPGTFPQMYVRASLGLLLTLYFPGYCLIKTLYPITLPVKTSSVSLDNIERFVLSLGLSLAVTPVVGLALYYTPIGVGEVPVTLSQLVVTVVLATTGILRDYQARRDLFLRKVMVVSDFELSETTLRFFAFQGFLSSRRIVAKEIPVVEITNVDSHGDELTVTYGGVSSIFLIRNGAISTSDLRDRVRSVIAGVPG